MFAAFACWYLVTIVYSPGQTSQSLDRLIDQACPEALGFTESVMDQHLPNWEGYRSVAGLNLVLDKHMTPGKSADATMACAYLLRNLAIPKDQISKTMMDRTKREAASDNDPQRLVYLLRKIVELVDRAKQGKEVVPFIAGFLNDKRPIEPQHRGPESVPRQQRRVCDGATYALINYMEETGLCEKYDVRFGNPGGETMWEQRESVMQAVVKVLQEKELLPTDFWAKLPPPRLPKSAPTSSMPATPSIQTSNKAQTEPVGLAATDATPRPQTTSGEPHPSTSWIIIFILSAVGIWSLWLFLKRRK